SVSVMDLGAQARAVFGEAPRGCDHGHRHTSARVVDRCRRSDAGILFATEIKGLQRAARPDALIMTVFGADATSLGEPGNGSGAPEPSFAITPLSPSKSRRVLHSPMRAQRGARRRSVGVREGGGGDGMSPAVGRA